VPGNPQEVVGIIPRPRQQPVGRNSFYRFPEKVGIDFVNARDIEKIRAHNFSS
jgi:hypothetical protein